MSTEKFARQMLQIAAANHQRRFAKVVRRQMASLNRARTAPGPEMDPRAGKTEATSDWRWTGCDADRLSPSDPHRALEALVLVEVFLSETPTLRPIYIARFVDGRRSFWRAGRRVGTFEADDLEMRLVQDLACWIGPVDEDAEQIAEDAAVAAAVEHFLDRMRQQRQRTAERVRRHRGSAGQ